MVFNPNYFFTQNAPVINCFYLQWCWRAAAAERRWGDVGGGPFCWAAAAPSPPRPSHSPRDSFHAEHCVFLVLKLSQNIFLFLFSKQTFNVLCFYIQKYLTFRLHKQAGAVEGVKGPPLPASCAAATAPTATPALFKYHWIKRWKYIVFSSYTLKNTILPNEDIFWF